MNPQFYLHWYWRFGEVVLQLGRSFIFPESQFSPSLIPLFTGHNHLKFSRIQENKQMPQFQHFSEEPTSRAPHPPPICPYAGFLPHSERESGVGKLITPTLMGGLPLIVPTGFPVILRVAKTPWRLSVTFAEKLNSYLKSLGGTFEPLKTSSIKMLIQSLENRDVQIADVDLINFSQIFRLDKFCKTGQKTDTKAGQ